MTLSRNGENVIPTPGGTVTVRPYRSSSNAQLKAVLSFTPRMSSLDRENTKSQTDEFRGFFTLFWIGELFLYSDVFERPKEFVRRVVRTRTVPAELAHDIHVGAY
jgi:hypothetical protein